MSYPEIEEFQRNMAKSIRTIQQETEMEEPQSKAQKVQTTKQARDILLPMVINGYREHPLLDMGCDQSYCQKSTADKWGSK